MINLNTHLDFLEQKNKIDSLIERGYVIVEVIENLDGSYVTFEKKDANGKRETLHITNANSRRYFSTLIFRKHQQEFEGKIARNL